MKTQITSVGVALALLSMPELTEGRKQLMDVNDERLRERRNPTVRQSEECKELCVFGTSEDKAYWCFSFTEPLCTFGWRYNQDANTSAESTPLKHLRFDLIFYLQNQFEALSKFDVYRLFYSEFTGELPRVDMEIDIGMIMNERWQYCPHVVWNRSAVGFNSTYRNEFMNCSKVILKNLWDVKGVWKGKYATWFEECERAQAGSSTSDDPQVTATFFQKDYEDAISEKVLLGSVDPESRAHCYKLPGAPVYSESNKGEYAYYNLVYQTLFNYVHNFKGSFARSAEYSLF